MTTILYKNNKGEYTGFRRRGREYALEPNLSDNRYILFSHETEQKDQIETRPDLKSIDEIEDEINEGLCFGEESNYYSCQTCGGYRFKVYGVTDCKHCFFDPIRGEWDGWGVDGSVFKPERIKAVAKLLKPEDLTALIYALQNRRDLDFAIRNGCVDGIEVDWEFDDDYEYPVLVPNSDDYQENYAPVAWIVGATGEDVDKVLAVLTEVQGHVTTN